MPASEAVGCGFDPRRVQFLESLNFWCCGNLVSYYSAQPVICQGYSIKQANGDDDNTQKPFCQGSSEVEQGTHKPLVGSSILPPGTNKIYGQYKISRKKRPPKR